MTYKNEEYRRWIKTEIIQIYVEVGISNDHGEAGDKLNKELETKTLTEILKNLPEYQHHDYFRKVVKDNEIDLEEI